MYENGPQQSVTSADDGQAQAHGLSVLVFVLGDLDGGVSARRDGASGGVLARRLLRPPSGRRHRLLRLGLVLTSGAAARHVAP